MRNLAKKLAEKDLYEMASIMGLSEQRMDKLQENRLITSIGILICGIVLLTVNTTIGGVIAFFALFKYRNFYSSYKKMFQNFKFQRNFEFEKLMKMVIPYMLQENAMPISTIFDKCRERLSEGIVKANVEKFLLDVIENPKSVEPYREFAYNSSGTDEADQIMVTIFDYEQESSDPSVIEELGRLINERMMHSIDIIKRMKTRRFGLFPTVVTMLPMIVIFGYVAGVLTYEMANFGEFF